ncbi:hypothetical protein NCCP2050_06020 [Planococcus sp. NCCP-2050]|nr:hypothetical protein NCCP2050_06020 [Planococcus sp. NCCP-2050]
MTGPIISKTDLNFIAQTPSYRLLIASVYMILRYLTKIKGIVPKVIWDNSFYGKSSAAMQEQ